MNQRELPLPFPELASDLPLMPARMVNEYEYCPRLAYLEWVQGEWAESGDTVRGRHVHRRVDKRGGKLPEAQDLEEDDRLHAHSITLSSNKLGLIAKMDLIESDAGAVVPVDYKQGKRPHVSKGAYAPERVQVCVQGLILREQATPATKVRCTSPAQRSACRWCLMTTSWRIPCRQLMGYDWLRPVGKFQRRWKTVQSVRVAASSASVFLMRWVF